MLHSQLLCLLADGGMGASGRSLRNTDSYNNVTKYLRVPDDESIATDLEEVVLEKCQKQLVKPGTR